MNQITMCNANRVAHSYKPTENLYPTLQVSSATEHFSVFQLIVGKNVLFLIESHCSYQCRSPKKIKNTHCTLPAPAPNSRLVEYLAAKKPATSRVDQD